MYTSDTKPLIGLALAGGGGKGAYQIGVWRALEELNIHVDVVAGSSAGALNGALICQGKYSEAHELWSTMNWRSVYSWGWLTVPVLFAQISYWSFIWRMPVRGRWLYLIVVGLVNTVLVALFGHDVSWLGLIWLLPLLTGAAVLVQRVYTRTAPFWLRLIATVVIASPLMLPSAFISQWLHSLVPPWLITPLVLLFVLFIGEVLVRWSIAALDNAPLRERITSLCDPQRLRTGPPLIATTAYVKEIFDPDRPKWFALPWPFMRRRTLKVGHFQVTIPASAVPFNEVVPVYTNLQQASDEVIHDVLLQSAAIPHVFAARLLGGVSAVDGGVADNVPIMPLIDAGCELIIVIHLNPQGRDKGYHLLHRQQLAARLEDLHRLEMLAAQRTEELVALYEATYGTLGTETSERQRQRGLMDGKQLIASPYQRVRSGFATIAPGAGGESEIGFLQKRAKGEPARATPQLPPAYPNILHIVPSRSLGGFMCGTMNFSAKKARNDMELGYKDMHTCWQQFMAAISTDSAAGSS